MKACITFLRESSIVLRSLFSKRSARLVQHQHYWKACQKSKFCGPTTDLLNQKLSKQSPAIFKKILINAICVLTSRPDDTVILNTVKFENLRQKLDFFFIVLELHAIQYWVGQKVRLGCSVTSYGPSRMNFLANPIYEFCG